MVRQVSLCFGKAFQRRSSSNAARIKVANADNVNGNGKSNNPFVFEVSLEMKEDDGKGDFTNVSGDRTAAFKLRTNLEKQIYLSMRQIFSNDQEELEIVRCFGVLVTRGWNVKHSDMLLDMISLRIRNEDGDSRKTYVITGKWDVKEPVLESLNLELNKLLPLTVAVDLVINKINEPVRLAIETHVKMYPQNERFWAFSKAQIIHRFSFYLKPAPCRNGNVQSGYEVTNIERSNNELDKSTLDRKWNNLTNLIKSSRKTALEGMSPKYENSDTDEPMVSGNGEVSKECPYRELELWNELLVKWTDMKTKPKQLNLLVRQGIPEALRCEVWQRLTTSEKYEELLNDYQILKSREYSEESVIQEDIHRTFPAHDYFKEPGGVGQYTLFNISKAYALYDTEIRYSQGLTFIAASLLLHMPEEQSFCVLVSIMYDYKLRNLYKDGFENLYVKLYQLDQLLKEKDPQLWQHFKEMGIETHMFAFHWFLTLFAVRFPLHFVFLILDMVLVLGLDTVFQIALSLLISCKNDLIALDFENILKYFQEKLPEKCRNQWFVRKLIARACNIKLKKLRKYERKFLSEKAVQESTELYTNELGRLRQQFTKVEEDNHKMKAEINQIKKILFLEMQKGEVEDRRNASIIADYKQICQRLDKERTATKALSTALQEWQLNPKTVISRNS